MKNRSPIRRVLRFVRFSLAVPVIVLYEIGRFNGWESILAYLILWALFIAIDAPIAYAEYLKISKGPMSRLPRRNQHE